jgi:hypothetical protein
MVGPRSHKNIPDGEITASHYHGNSPSWGKGEMWRARFDSPTGWIGSTNLAHNAWIQWEFDTSRTIDSIMTLGAANANYFTKAYKMAYSDDGSDWTWYWRGAMLTGNTIHHKLVENRLASFKAKYVRLFPVLWSSYPAMRVDFSGCPPTPMLYTCAKEFSLVGELATPWLGDEMITASSYYQNNAVYGKDSMWRSRIDNTHGSWSAGVANKAQWVQWDFGKTKKHYEAYYEGPWHQWVVGQKLQDVVWQQP